VQHGLTAEVVAVDWRCDLPTAATTLRKLGLAPSLQGNLDPLLLSFGDEQQIRAQVRTVLNQVATLNLPGHIFNVGHGLLPSTNPEALGWVVDEVHRHSMV
jgi:uroporphyrinogen decarboxylase